MNFNWSAIGLGLKHELREYWAEFKEQFKTNDDFRLAMVMIIPGIVWFILWVLLLVFSSQAVSPEMFVGTFFVGIAASMFTSGVIYFAWWIRKTVPEALRELEKIGQRYGDKK